MEHPATYIPIDRRHALASGVPIPDRGHGAALFADISGFTPLTEALARALGPRRGAEELTAQLNRLFDALIAPVDTYGGTVVGFSGDAITCWFAGEAASAGRRAVAAALAMQNAMRSFAGLPLPGGTTVTLAMKAAVATGAARRFVVGDPELHVIDVLAGTTLERLAATEHVARSGEVLICAVTAAALHDDLLPAERRVDDHGNPVLVVRALRSYVAPTPWPELPPGVLSETLTRPWLLPGLSERLRAGGGAFLAELRPVVVLFLRFGGIDYDGDDSAGERLDAFIRWVQHVLARYEGSLVQLTMGDKGSYMVAAFGALVAHPDDAARAVSAALEVRALPDWLAWVGPVQIGLSRGMVRCGPYGGVTRRTYGVLGDEVNLAARLMQLAAPGQVLASEHVQLAARELYEWESLPAVRVKGKSTPIALFEPLAPRPHMRQARGELVGREPERAALAELLRQLTHGRSSQALIEGEPGIGKSRLLAELLSDARAAGVNILASGADPVEQSTPYHAWRAIFATACGSATAEGGGWRETLLARIATDPELARVAPLLNVVLPLDLPDTELTAQMSGQVRADNTRAALLRLLRQCAGGAPLLLVIEDAHWLDSSSWALLDQVRTEHAPLLLAVTTRPFATPPPEYRRLASSPGCHHLHLGQLNPQQVERLVCQTLGVARVPPEVVELIHARAEGQPFFIEELAHALSDTGVIRVIDGICQVAPRVNLENVSFPDTIQGTISSRIDRLSGERQLVLKVASVIGRVFAATTLADVHPVPDERRHIPLYLDDLGRLEITARVASDPELAYIFRHVITQEVVYNQMLFAQRGDLHRRVAEWYEGAYHEDIESHFGLLAHHWEKAERPDRAAYYLERAGEQAMRGGAYQEAIRLYTRLINLEPEPHGEAEQIRRAAIERQLGEASMGLGLFDEGRRYFCAALARLGRPLPERSAGVALGILQAMVVQVLHRAWPARFIGQSRRPAADRECSRIYIKVAQIDYMRAKTALMLYEALHNLNTAEGLERSLELAGAYSSVGLICAFIPIHGLAAPYIGRARATVEALGRPTDTAEIYELVSVYLSGIGRLNESAALLERILPLFEQIGHRRLWDESSILLGMTLLPLGEVERAERIYRALSERSKHYGNENVRCSSTLGLAEIASLRGRAAEAIAALEPIEELARRIGVGEQIWRAGVLAQALLYAGQAEAADSVVATGATLTARAAPVNYYALPGYAGLAEVSLRRWAQAHGTPEAPARRRAAEQAVRALGRFAHTFPLGKARLLLCQGQARWLAGRPAEAMVLWQEALTVAARTRLPYEEGLAHLAIGSRLPADHPGRAQHLTRADEHFARLGAYYAAAEVDRALAAGGPGGSLR